MSGSQEPMENVVQLWKVMSLEGYKSAAILEEKIVMAGRATVKKLAEGLDCEKLLKLVSLAKEL